MKTKRELRQEAIERLKKDINYPGYYRALIKDIVGDDFDEFTGHACVETIIDLLTDDDDDMGDYIKLPKDANGEVIHIGDEMDYSKNVRGLTVIGVGIPGVHNSYAGLMAGVFVRDADCYTWYSAKSLRHHKPTMKDVLWDFLHAADDAMRRGYEEPPSEVFDEFTAKLKEAMDECE